MEPKSIAGEISSNPNTPTPLEDWDKVSVEPLTTGMTDMAVVSCTRSHSISCRRLTVCNFCVIRHELVDAFLGDVDHRELIGALRVVVRR